MIQLSLYDLLVLDISKGRIVHEKENNKESQKILEDNREHLTSQCVKILELFKSGVRLTVRDAMLNHGIGDLRRRVKDLKDSGYDIKSDMIGKNYKEYYL